MRYIRTRDTFFRCGSLARHTHIIYMTMRGSIIFSPTDLWGRMLPPLMKTSSLTCTSSPRTDTLSIRAHRPTDEYQPTMDLLIQAFFFYTCHKWVSLTRMEPVEKWKIITFLIWASFISTQLLSRTPSSIMTPGPMVTFGPILHPFPILAVGSTRTFPTKSGPFESLSGALMDWDSR